MRTLGGRKPPGRCVVLYFHHIPAGSRARFARQMDLLKKVAITRPADVHRADGGREEVCDRDVRRRVPERGRQRHPGVDEAGHSLSRSLVPTGYLGRLPGWEVAPAYRNELGPVVDADGLKALPGMSVVVGSHTVSHANLASAGADDARKEMIDSKILLESILGREVTVLSIPYGGRDASHARHGSRGRLHPDLHHRSSERGAWRFGRRRGGEIQRRPGGMPDRVRAETAGGLWVGTRSAEIHGKGRTWAVTPACAGRACASMWTARRRATGTGN